MLYHARLCLGAESQQPNAAASLLILNSAAISFWTIDGETGLLAQKPNELVYHSLGFQNERLDKSFNSTLTG